MFFGIECCELTLYIFKWNKPIHCNIKGVCTLIIPISV